MSPLHGDVYPVRWRLTIPRQGLKLPIAPLVEGLEMKAPSRSWRDAVTVDGRGREGAVSGFGFVDLTGYADTPPVD